MYSEKPPKGPRPRCVPSCEERVGIDALTYLDPLDRPPHGGDLGNHLMPELATRRDSVSPWTVEERGDVRAAHAGEEVPNQDVMLATHRCLDVSLSVVDSSLHPDAPRISYLTLVYGFRV
jgi:hypothetical protein